jgi:hypothetical protein
MEEQPLKRCSKCKAEKPIIAFAKDRTRKSGLEAQCKDCKKVKNKIYNDRPENKVKKIEENARWKSNNPSKYKVYHANYRKAHRDKAIAYIAGWIRFNRDRSIGYNNKRKALKMGNGHIPYRTNSIYEDANWICEICSLPIDSTLQGRTPMAKSIDHIWPIIVGGPDIKENVRAAHFGCNVGRPKNGSDVLPEDVWIPLPF